ncbi:MAG: hypothetical protein JXB32_17145 [Deltaproteobacteria bacterium]|nr:hypothetical protein [Deltaproteobacteria bacterium]
MSTTLRIALLVAVAVLVLATGRETAVSADDTPQLPTGCWSGEVVVARSGGGFECQDLREYLHLSGCNDGDFVTWSSNGHLSCTRPNWTSSGSRGLLPECSSGEIVVSEGFGRWRCANRE